jgi:hypothetical protein
VDGATELAAIVTTLVRELGLLFPVLPAVLRRDVSLADPPEGIWLPKAGAAMTQGALANVHWVKELKSHRAGSTSLGAVHIKDDLLGLRVVVDIRNAIGFQTAATVTLADPSAYSLARALASRITALAESGGRVRDLATLSVRVDAETFVADAQRDLSSFRSVVRSYRAVRDRIEEMLLGAV